MDQKMKDLYAFIDELESVIAEKDRIIEELRGRLESSEANHKHAVELLAQLTHHNRGF